MPTIEIISDDEVLTVGDADVEILIRRIPSEVYQEIRARHTAEVRDSERAGEPGRKVTDEPAVDRDVLDYIVMDWPKGVTAQGARVPCTRANKLRLPGGIRAQLIAMAFAAVNTHGDEAALKNLHGSSATPPPAEGAPTSPA